MSFIDIISIDERIKHCICETQADIYLYANKHGYDMELFSKEYLSSNFCNLAMDAEYSVFQMADPIECMDFIEKEVTPPILNEPNFDEFIIEWIGYIYRELHFYSKLSSKEINDKISFKDMVNYYPGLCTEDNSIALDILAEDFLGKERQYE